MKKKIFFIFIVLVLPAIVIAQSNNSGCIKIKNGTFYYYPQGAHYWLKVIRNKEMQMEIDSATQDTSYWKINWVGDCEFTVRFLQSSQMLTKKEEEVMSSAVVHVTVLKENNDYYLFNASLKTTYDDNKRIDTMWLKQKR